MGECVQGTRRVMTFLLLFLSLYKKKKFRFRINSFVGLHTTIIVEKYNKNWMFKSSAYHARKFDLCPPSVSSARYCIHKCLCIRIYPNKLETLALRAHVYAVMLQLEPIYTYPRCVRSTFLLQRRTHDARGSSPDSTNKNRINGSRSKLLRQGKHILENKSSVARSRIVLRIWRNTFVRR